VELLLIRHGLPVRRETPDGRPADPPLSETGREQASALSTWLEREEIHRLYASPLSRALETAQPLAQSKKLELEIEPRIREFDGDSSTYIPLEELRATDYDAWLEFIRGGYGDGRDLQLFRRGVVAGIEDIIAANPGRTVAVVCHGGVINAWAAHVLRLEQAIFFNPNYTSINRFAAARSGERSVGSLNEAAHLRDFSTSA
jgi:probable phosphoglycerate mutase